MNVSSELGKGDGSEQTLTLSSGDSNSSQLDFNSDSITRSRI